MFNAISTHRTAPVDPLLEVRRNLFEKTINFLVGSLERKRFEVLSVLGGGKTKFWKEKHKTECFYVINILRDNKRAEMAGWCEGKLLLFLNLEIKVFPFYLGFNLYKQNFIYEKFTRMKKIAASEKMFL